MLINLKTDLTSLKFGKDRPGGGSSNQPYIEKPLNLDLPPALDFLGNDFILRGGPVGAPLATANDIARLTKYFTDFKNPSGLLFVAKQNLLSRTAVKTQTSGDLNEGIYTPLSTLAQVGVSAFGLHLNKQGLNPFEETGAYATNNENLYGVKVTPLQDPKENRLVGLYQSKILLDPTFIPEGLKDFYSANNQIILKYNGGPNSDLGIGNTHIRFADQRTGDASTKNIYTNNTFTYSQSELNNIPKEDIGNGESFYVGSGEKGAVTTPGDFRQKLRTTNNQKTTKEIGNLTNAPNYISQNIETRVNLGDQGNRNGKNLNSYISGAFDAGSPYGAASPNSYDKINIYPLYQSENVTNDPTVNDLVKFRIGVINNENPSQKTYIHFRAFLDQISDQYVSDWDPTQYIGRGEKFYTYKGFDRKVSLSWTVAAQSKAELIPMYKKLNYLASVCAPDYSGNGYMRGNIITLTIGGYFHEQPGIITGFSYEMNEENATWEIGINDNTSESDPSVKELPHLIKVTGFNFIPIHKFVPRKVQGEGNFSVKEKYISLQAVTNNYDRQYSPDFIRSISFNPNNFVDFNNLGLEDLPN